MDPLASLGNVRQVFEAGSAEERKAVVQTYRRAILRWYRLPRDVSVELVAVGGIEPPTRGL